MSSLDKFSNLELAQALAERMIIAPKDWHRLKSNRQAQAMQQITAGLILLLKGEQNESLTRFQHVVGWLNYSISTPKCPTHGTKKK